MAEDVKKKKKLTLVPLALMCVTTVFMFTNIPRSFFLMGYFAIPWYVLSAIAFFVPFAFMIAEYGAAFKNEKGGIYSWLEKSVGPKYGFIGIFMWYIGWLVWVVLTCSSIWVHFSTILFGNDTTSTWGLFGLNSTRSLGILSIIFIVTLTFIATRGLDKIIKVTSLGGISVGFINIAAYVGAVVVLLLNHGHIAQAINVQTFLHSPNPGYSSPVAILSFVAFSIVAYGGIEVVGGVVDQTEEPEKTFPKGILMGAAFISMAYAVGIFAVGIFTNWAHVLSGKNVNMVNAVIIVMNNLGYEIGSGLGLTQAGSLTFGRWVARFAGLSMFLTYVGSLINVSYSPLKQMIEGVPKELWPGKLGKLSDDMPKNAMWAQCALIAIILALVSFGGEGANKFFNKLVLMTNVAMTLPYMFITGAFPKFKKNESIKKPFSMFKSCRSVLIWSVIATLTVGFANFFLIIQPATTGDWSTTIWTIAGPVVFSAISLLMYKRYENIMKTKEKQKN
ncbi:glutamate/gamma-aminobutyrate family transporter YjeM [Clostridium sp. Mt-5]|uniref:Glutamate/gamma-aminobutyrate family transporter YjeM n=1 Tax=Clostridium moutaii TaxID=3240932 RepID=A0ABV4BPH6_9CLOT